MAAVSPELLRAYILIVTRDVLAPCVGLFLWIYLPATHQFASWQVPGLTALVGVPFVAARKNGKRDGGS